MTSYLFFSEVEAFPNELYSYNIEFALAFESNKTWVVLGKLSLPGRPTKLD